MAFLFARVECFLFAFWLFNRRFSYIHHDHAESRQGSSDKESPRITMRTERRANGVVISIADNGSGMPSDVKDRIFEPFFTTKSVGKGTGMAISYQLITENHKGKLACFSEFSRHNHRNIEFSWKSN